jgi:hypothetical protein
MKRKANLRTLTLSLAIASALGISAAFTSAYAAGSAFKSSHPSTGTEIDPGYGNLHGRHGWHTWNQFYPERDVWGHWGTYYGPPPPIF